MDWPTLSRAMNRSPTYARIHGRCTRPMETTGTPADTASPGSAKRVSTTPSSGAMTVSCSRIASVARNPARAAAESPLAARWLSATAAAISDARAAAASACARRWLISASSPGCSSTAIVSPRCTVSPSSLSSRARRPDARGASWSSRISTVPLTRSVSPWRRHPEQRATAASAKACAVLLTLRAASAARLQPVDRVQGDAALAPDLEVQVGSLIARPTAHVAEDLAFGDPFAASHARVTQVAIKTVVAAAVIHQHGEEVGAEGSREAHAAARNGADRRAGRRRDSDAVPRDARVVRAGGGAELVHDPPLHGPVELAQVRGGDGGSRGSGAALFGLTAGPLQGDDAVVQALLVTLELGQALQGLTRTAPRLTE